MNYIEIIGPQGVGKTCLLDQLVSRRSKGATWRTWKEAMVEIASSVTFSQMNSTSGKFIYWLNKLSPLPYKRQGMALRILREIIPEYSDKLESKYDYLIQGHLVFWAANDLGFSAREKIRLLNWHAGAVFKYVILDSMNYGPVVLLDEGLLKNHFGLANMDLYNAAPDTLPKAVIYCYASSEKYYLRVMKRRDITQRLSIVHQGVDDDSLMDIVKRVAEVSKKNMEILRKTGIPVLDVDVGETLTESGLQTVAAFIDSHCVGASYRD